MASAITFENNASEMPAVSISAASVMLMFAIYTEGLENLRLSVSGLLHFWQSSLNLN